MKKAIFFALCIIAMSSVLRAQNPGFETGDLTGWTNKGGGTPSVQSTTVRTGSYSGKYVTNVSGSDQRWLNETNTLNVNTDVYYIHVIGWVNPVRITKQALEYITMLLNLGGITSALLQHLFSLLVHGRD